MQTGLFTKLLAEAGHEVHISAFYGIRGATTKMNGCTVYPGGMDGYGNDMLPLHVKHVKPDAVVALLDIWVMQHDTLRQVPNLAFWSPVDHVPMPPAVADRLPLVAQPWAMSRFAEREMKAVGLNPWYVPHGVNTDVYRPVDRDKARAKLDVKPGQFMALSVQANKGWPSRKSVDRLLKAWARFCETHPDALLYLHTNPVEAHGMNLRDMADFYGVAERVRFPDVYRLMTGYYGPTEMNVLYNAADAFVLPSAGGGFEIPLVEAQAAGTPVVTTAVTAMTELVGPGYGIPVDDFDGLMYTTQGSEQANVLPSQILAGLEWAYERMGDTALREAARAFAEPYDARQVLKEYMLPALEALAGRQPDEAERDARTAARQALRARYEVPVGERFPQEQAI